MDNEKKLNVSHLLWQAVKRALYAYIQSWRTAAAAAPRIARQGVLFHIKSSTAPPHTSRFLLHLRGWEAGEKEKHVCDSFYCHVRHVLEWSWLKSRRRGRESLRVFQALGCITTSAMTRLLTTWEILSLGKNHDPMAVNRCWLRILEFSLQLGSKSRKVTNFLAQSPIIHLTGRPTPRQKKKGPIMTTIY